MLSKYIRTAFSISKRSKHREDERERKKRKYRRETQKVKETEKSENVGIQIQFLLLFHVSFTIYMFYANIPMLEWRKCIQKQCLITVVFIFSSAYLLECIIILRTSADRYTDHQEYKLEVCKQSKCNVIDWYRNLLQFK